MDKEYLTRRQAAEYVKRKGLPCAASTLAKLATIGGGPSFQKFGRNVVYTCANLDAWIQARLSDPKPHTAA